MAFMRWQDNIATRARVHRTEGGCTVKKIWLLASVVGLWCGPALAQTTDELLNDGKNTDNVLTQSMGYDRKSYSPLKQINKSNVKRLVPVWSTSLMNDIGELARADGLQRRDVRRSTASGRSPSTSRPAGRSGARRSRLEPACSARSGAINRGAPTIYNGKLFRVTIDNHVLALDMKTGKEVWKQKFADCKEGYYCDQRADRRQRRADLRHGRRRIDHARLPRRLGSRHRQETVAPLHHSGAGRARLGDLAEGQRRLEVRRRPDLALRLLRSAARSRLLGHRQRRALRSAAARGAGQSLHVSVLAIRPKTGEIVCHYQYTPNDVYDVDGTDEHGARRHPVDGQMRKVMIQANKNGFMYVLDRTNCKLIAAHPFTSRSTGRRSIDLATGRPVLTDVYKRFARRRRGRDLAVARHQRGADRVQSEHRAGLCQHLEPAAHPEARAAEAAGASGADSTGVDRAAARVKPGDVVGLLHRDQSADRREEMGGAADRHAELGRHAGDRRRAGVHRQADRRVHRARRRTPARRCGSSRPARASTRPPITYTHKGRQYVTRRVRPRRRSRAALCGATRCRPAARCGRSR